ncbi:MAG: hypothetical protein GKR90_06375 [Pseudomonadales bacterium]|nr:hypothetical protein [Pseudomonadales bacterium]
MAVVALTLFACSESEEITPASEAPDALPEKPMPPGFLDEPPPPPTSATAILSGGTLLLPDGGEIPDSLVVITNGDLVAWGTRGAVDVPNDSIGFDLRGKWIEPIALDPQAQAALRIADQDPRVDSFNGTYVGGYEDGTLTLPEPED